MGLNNATTRHVEARQPLKFTDAHLTANGERRAAVTFQHMDILWFNTGTLCNIECKNCYIESSPINDGLSYLTKQDLVSLLDEAERIGQRPAVVGFTGGEPFMNPTTTDMLDAALERGHDVLVLTNAMRPMMRARVQTGLLELNKKYTSRLTLRVSLDHWRPELHDEERGTKSFDVALRGLKWLCRNNFRIAVAGRLRWGDAESEIRGGFAELFAKHEIELDSRNPQALMLFPEMDENAPVPEITDACWGLLNRKPGDMMCASSRMIVKRKGATGPTVVACTLLPYDMKFDFGSRLMDALLPVKLNHPHCSKFCVLGGGSCSK
ncbi:MAG: radical SAM protein [Micropepsaceae bacterium]